jgi:tetratricopeptide (TPR) repeat protein
MQPRRHVLLSTTAGGGQPAGDARLAALVALLRRRARTPLVAVVPDAARARAVHPDLPCIDDADLAAALQQAELVCIAGGLDTDFDLERAARHAAAARLHGVPVAVVAAALGGEAAAAPVAWSEILSQCESVSAADADSAARLTVWRGRRVDTVAPSELVLEPEAGAAVDRRGCIGIDAALVCGLDAGAVDALRVALRAYAPRLVVLLGECRRGALAADAVRIETVSPAWPAWRRAVGRCEIVLGAASGGIAATVLALGAVPVVAAARTPLHARIALDACTVGALQDPGAWARALAAAACAARTLAARVAPLRALAWRALGPLADAGRAAAPDLQHASAPARALWAAAGASLAAPALAAGDGARAERVLDACGDALATEPVWAEARARADALLGHDAIAVARLERAAAAAPNDARLQAALARALVRCGDAGAATLAWQRAAALLPHAAEPYWEIAQLALVAGRVADALSALADALGREPAHAPSTRTVRALLDSEPQREVEFWRALCAAHAGVPGFWHQRALAAERAGAWADAASCAARALDLAPRDPEILALQRHAADNAALHAGPAPADESAAVAGGPRPGV